VRGLRVTFTLQYRWLTWRTVIGFLPDPFTGGGHDEHWAVITVRDATGRKLARRRFGDHDEAQLARDRFVGVVESLTDAQLAGADWAEVLRQVDADGPPPGERGAPPQGEVLVAHDEGYVVPALRGTGVHQVVAGAGSATLHLGSNTVVLDGRARVHAADGTITHTTVDRPEALDGLRGAVCARLALRHDGRLILDLADGRWLEALAAWEVWVRGRAVAASRPGGVRLLPGHPRPDP
jgi:hypothetical protein